VTDVQRTRFLEELAAGGTVADACHAAGFSRQYAYERRKVDAEFGQAWVDVLEAGTEQLEREAGRRAMMGSDLLMIFLLKSRRPEVYRDRYEVTHTAQQLTGGDLAAIRAAGGRPELSGHLDALAEALAAEHRAPRRIEPEPSDVDAQELEPADSASTPSRHTPPAT
jgi:hypothetical protein